MFVRCIHTALAIPVAFLSLSAAEEFGVPMYYCNFDIEIADTMSFGKSTGIPFCIMRIKDGAFINGIEAWSNPTLRTDWPIGNNELGFGAMFGLEVSYTDGKTTMIGQQEGKWYSEIK